MPHELDSRSVASLIDFSGNTLKRLAALLLIHDAAGFGIALGPIPIWGLELRSMID
jgi:hypothetical protein